MARSGAKRIWPTAAMALVIATAAIAAVGYWTGGFPAKQQVPDDTEAAAPAAAEAAAPRYRNPLTGFPSSSPMDRRPVAVVFSGAAQAQPPWGLSTPDLVVEGLADQGTTLLLGLYADISAAPKVGPVGSLRPALLELAMDWDAIPAHWGSDAQSDRLLEEAQWEALNGAASEGKFFFLDQGRAAQGWGQAGYTSGSFLNQAIAAMDLRLYRNRTPSLSFAPDDAPVRFSNETYGEIRFRFSESAQYSFRREQTSGLLEKWNGGSPVRDAEGSALRYRNVLLLLVPAGETGTPALSAGSGLFFTDGGYTTILWSRNVPATDSQPARQGLQFFDGSGTPLELNVGQSYIGFIPLDLAAYISMR
ncbi:MAG: DUF3048 domain-containing protein [Oscillospiraceae bacterium]|jgi:hypothetical protein|nr:DUF3048 domain-containing protein [Oscillospiraceae bacterium]